MRSSWLRSVRRGSLARSGVNVDCKITEVARGSAPNVAISPELEQLKHVLIEDLHGPGVAWIEIDNGEVGWLI